MSPQGRYPWPEASKPIAVEGGIKAKSKRGAIGSQWWSQRFIAVLESYGISGRLQRGRAYARKGQVLEFSLSVGKVAARVQGSRVGGDGQRPLVSFSLTLQRGIVTS